MADDILPGGWTPGTVGSHCSLLNGLAFKPEDWTDLGVPIIRIQNLNGSTDFNRSERPVGPAYLIKPGTLLFSWSGNRGTSFGPYRWHGPTGILNQHIFKVTPRESTDPDWFYHALDVVRVKVERAAHGGLGLVHVRRGDLLAYKVPTPPLSEQHRIAKILDTLDEAIRETEQVIAKLQQMKQGLLHDLLTRGIGENGELRDPDCHPEQFKDSPLGRLARGWEVRPLVEVAEIHSGVAKNTNRVVGSAVWVHYLRVANVQDGFLDLSEMSKIRIGRDEVQKYAVLDGDVLMNEGGDLDKLGRGAVWRGEFSPCVHQNHVFVVRCGTSLLPDFLNAWTGSPPARRYFILAGKQTTNLASINKTALGRLPIAVPPVSEQAAIIKALRGYEARISFEKAECDKLRALKSGLMDDLLTGRVRVTPEEPAR